MRASDPSGIGPERSPDRGESGADRPGDRDLPFTTAPIGLLDALGVAAAVMDSEGTIMFWSPQAEDLFGYSAEEALGRPGGDLLVAPEDLPVVMDRFKKVLAGDIWAGGYPVRCGDGTTRQVEFRHMRLLDRERKMHVLAIATDQEKLRTVETDLALSTRVISQTPGGIAILDKDLRYVRVNPALAQMHGLPAEEHIGKTIGDVIPTMYARPMEAAAREVMRTGEPYLDRIETGRTPADPNHMHAWALSLFRMEDTNGEVLGVAASVLDVTDRHRAEAEAQRARRRLALVAAAGVRVGTTLDLSHTAEELADVAVPDLADLAAVDLLDSVLAGSDTTPVMPREGAPDGFRALAVRSAYPTEATTAADPTGEVTSFAPDRMITKCVTEGRPVHVAHVDEAALSRIARDERAASVLAGAGAHSYLAVPLIARGKVIGALSLVRARNPLPFDKDDVLLATELAARAAVSIDNARFYNRERRTALTLQRSLLPQRPPRQPGLEIAYRYQPAGPTSEVGGDWFDVFPLPEEKTALVVGDVMGSGVNAAATMGQFRTATRTLTGLDYEPATLLQRLNDAAIGFDETFATCVFVVFDPITGLCRISNAGHLPPVVVHPDGTAELLEVRTGAPLGVSGVPFETIDFAMAPDDQLILYTDGLVETRTHPIDERLNTMVGVLSGAPDRTVEETCDVLLHSLREPANYDDVALVVARRRGAGAE